MARTNFQTLCLIIMVSLTSAKKCNSSEGEEGGEGNGDENEQQNRQLKVSTIMLIVSGLVSLSVGFEWAKEKLFERTSSNMKPILVSLFAEVGQLRWVFPC